MNTQKPPFRAEHIGSLLRPKSLLDLRRRKAAGEPIAAELARAEDDAIAKAVALQLRVGLKVATDGEFRRQAYHSFFYAQLGDISLEAPDHKDEQNGQASAARVPTRGAQPLATIKTKLTWAGPIHAGDYQQLAALTKAAPDVTPKITIPGPCALHFRGGNAAVLAHAYSDVDQFWDDTVTAFQKELASLSDAGCTYIQIDETAFAKFGDPAVQATLAQRGEDWSALIDHYISITNRVLAGAPKSLTIGMHLCRGNRGGQFHAEGSYDSVAERLFNALDVGCYFLEYDSPRAGDFSPLRLVPASKHVVLGMVSTKSGHLESKDVLKRRLDEAARFVDLDRLSISPQCGFASIDTGNPLSEAEQEAKLRLVVDTAREVWGSA